MSTTPRSPAHSLIGASAMPRLIACPASFGLSQQVQGGGGTSIHAATGTVAHALAEEALTQNYDPASQLGVTVTVDRYDITVTDEMVAATRIYIDEVRRRAAGAAWFALETRVVLDDYWTPKTRPRVSAFGTADMLAYHLRRRHLDVTDYKNGAGVYVDANSAQLHYYAAGALLEIIARGYPPPRTIDLTIVQPNVRGREKIRTFPTSTLDVLMWVDDVLKPVVAEAMAPGARIVAGAHCRYCPARIACPALTSIRQELARRDFGPSPDEPVHLTEIELGEVLRELDLIEAHKDALREAAQAKIAAGVAVPGWALAPTRPVRGWSVPGPVLETQLSEHGRMLLYPPTEPRTPAQLERMLSPADWAAIQPFVQSKSSGVRLVPDTADPIGNSGRASAWDDFA